MLHNVFAKTLCDQRRWLCWWLLGLATVTPVYVLPYRQVLDSGRLKVTGGAGAIASDEEADARSGHRGATLGFTAALAVAAYLTNTVAPRVDALKAAQKWSPFYYLVGDPLRTGTDVGDLAVLAAIPLVMVGLALWWLNRRGVAVSAGRSA